LGDGHGKRLARQELLAFLRSADPELRGLAALGLASIHEEVVGELEQELERLAALPGDKGALAESYLDLERGKRLRDRRLEELQQRFSEQLLPADLARFDAVLRMVSELHLDGEQVDREQLVDVALAGMLRALDEHSSYMSPEVYADFVQDLEAEYGGIGAYVGEDPADGLFTITRPIYSGPAYKAGLQTDDKIVRVGDWPTIGQPTDDVIKRLKGKPGTPVELYVWRRGMDPERIERPTDDMRVEIERAIIEIPAVHYQMLPGDVGMIEVTTFSRVVARELAEALVDLRSKGMRSVVIDLRRNSGGLLSEAVRVAELFLPAGKAVVHTEYRGQPTQTLYTQNEPLVPADVPVAVLVSRYTASASEIVAGALQDHGRATLLGDRTYGKGSVQNLERVEGYYDDRFEDENRNGRFDDWEVIDRDWDSDGKFDFAPRVKLTIARYLLPSGRSIHRELDRDGTLLSEGGVEPDAVVDLPRVEAWRWEERLKLRDANVPRDYVDRYWSTHRERLAPLAETDLKDPGLYPGFDELYASLGTPLPKDDVRALLRAEVRRRVQDERGGAFPLGDFQEDVQVQEAIRQLLGDVGQDPLALEAYRRTFTEQPEVTLRMPLAVAANSAQSLEAARESLRRAREQGVALTPAELDLVLELLGSAEGN
ncbi:MAG TPA: S41 family peptidase, partial [Planctomycetota bacterium]|nr:S41 family peptidase [Planctomycetota bacterium]